MVSLLDIIGPVMVGPSSSHTAGACRLGLLARCLVGGTPHRARIELHGSFARTGEGHGTDKAIVGGLMGFRPDDERLRDVLGIAEREGLEYRFEKTTLGEDADVHPNTVRITVERERRTAVMVGSSLGAGRVLVTNIDGYPVEVTGNYHTIVLVAEDIPGSVARIAGILADHAINIATLRLTRKERGGDAFMVIELDDDVRDAESQGKSLARLALETEARDQGRPIEEIRAALRRALQVMRGAVAQGLTGELKSASGLVGGDAAKLRTGPPGPLAGTPFRDILARALAVQEVNAAMGVIVAAPTAGGAGVLPAVLSGLAEARGIADAG